MKKYVNGQLLDMASDEITARNAEVKERNDGKAARDIAGTDGQADRDIAALRTERNKRLADTDYLALSDTADATSAQTTYRQALRDITNNATSLDDVTWPTKP